MLGIDHVRVYEFLRLEELASSQKPSREISQNLETKVTQTQNSKSYSGNIGGHRYETSLEQNIATPSPITEPKEFEIEKSAHTSLIGDINESKMQKSEEDLIRLVNEDVEKLNDPDYMYCENINLDNAASNAGVNKHKYLKYFRRITNKSWGSYVKMQKQEVNDDVKDMLTKEMKLDAICAELGILNVEKLRDGFLAMNEISISEYEAMLFRKKQTVDGALIKKYLNSKKISIEKFADLVSCSPFKMREFIDGTSKPGD